MKENERCCYCNKQAEIEEELYQEDGELDGSEFVCFDHASDNGKDRLKPERQSFVTEGRLSNNQNIDEEKF